MADIKIDGLDERRSKRTITRVTLYYILSERPSRNWISTFNELVANQETDITGYDRVKLEGQFLIVEAPGEMTKENLRAAMDQLVDEVNKGQSLPL